MKHLFNTLMLGCILGAGFVGCSEDDSEEVVPEVPTMEEITGIPSDDTAGENPEVGESNTNIPNFNYTVENKDGYTIIRLDLTGIQDPETLEWLRLIGTGSSEQNIWVSVDDNPKGFTVYNSADEMGQSIKADLVFLVDNSGSMSAEADSVAAGISSWAKKLAHSGLDIRFGCVGYGGHVGAQYANPTSKYGITGALNLTTDENLDAYLNRAYSYGTDRTFGYAGDDADSLEVKVLNSYSVAGGECGVQALRFADEHFNFRKGANRIYVNFTDDANYPGGDKEISVDYVKNHWSVSKGTIHTVLSNDSSYINNRLDIGEKSWLMSRYTGGTELYVNQSFSGVSLDDLPVTGAMQNSYIIRFTNVDEFMDGREHRITITVLTLDGKVKAEKTFTIIFGIK